MSATTTTIQYETRPASEAIELRHLGSGPSSSRQTGPETKEAPQSEDAGDDGGEPPMNALTEAERWNRPAKNIGRLAFAFMSFAIAGMNDAAFGVSGLCSSVLYHEPS